MRHRGLLGVGVLGFVLSASGVAAQDFDRYRQPPNVDDDAGTLIAEWGSTDHAVRLHRLSSYTTTFRLVITAESVATLARTAAARAVVLDAREAPQREAEREKKEADDRRAAEEKARLTNKATFRP